MNARLLHLVLGFLLIANLGNSQIQISHDTIAFNDSKVLVNNNLSLAFNADDSSSLYYTPKDSLTQTWKNIAFWCKATFLDGTEGLAATIDGVNGADVFPGPIATDYNSSAYQNNYSSSMYHMTQATVAKYYYWWQACYGPNASSVDCASIPLEDVPTNEELMAIYTWPAHGDMTNGEDYWLAPYWNGLPWDGNAMYLYDPINEGDVPLIKGCESVYIISNDSRAPHAESGGQAMGVEFHMQVYQMEELPEASFLKWTTFVDIEVRNEGIYALNNLKLSALLEPYSNQTYAGTDTINELVYYYYADNLDVGPLGEPGFGQNPPAFGLFSLSDELSSVVPVQGTALQELYNYTDGKLADGSMLMDNQGLETPYYFFGDPTQANSYAQVNGQASLNQRVLATFPMGSMNPGESLSATFALIQASGGDYLSNVTNLSLVADSLRQYFVNVDFSCAAIGHLTLEENEMTSWNVYPNPTVGSVTIENSLNSSFDVTFLDQMGRVCLKQLNMFSGQSINVSTLLEGVYFLRVDTPNSFHIEKIVVTQ